MDNDVSWRFERPVYFLMSIIHNSSRCWSAFHLWCLTNWINISLSDQILVGWQAGIIFLSQNLRLLYSQLNFGHWTLLVGRLYWQAGIIFAASRKEGRMMREESRGVSCVFCSTRQEISLYHTTVERPYTTYMSLFSKAIWANLCTSHTP